MATIPVCNSPSTLIDKILLDEYDMFSNDKILDMWNHYRLTDGDVKRVYGDPPADIKTDGTLMATPHYNDIYNQIRPFFKILSGTTDDDVSTIRQLVVVSNKEDNIVIIHKKNWDFWKGVFKIPDTLRKEFNDQFEYVAKSNKTDKRLIEISVSQCGQPATPMEKLMRVTLEEVNTQ